jgi:hypothetical protein
MELIISGIQPVVSGGANCYRADHETAFPNNSRNSRY